MKLWPSNVRPRSTRLLLATYDDTPQPHYLFHDGTVVVTSCGPLCLCHKDRFSPANLAIMFCYSLPQKTT